MLLHVCCTDFAKLRVSTDALDRRPSSPSVGGVPLRTAARNPWRSAHLVQAQFTGGGVKVLNSSSSLFVKKLASGAAISNGAGKFSTNQRIERWAKVASTSSARLRGSFPPTATGFVGVSFQVGAQTDYGWIRLQVTDGGAGDGYPHQVTAVDWAYDDSGAPSMAGHMGGTAVPEPASATLALLAAGALGVCALRRRKQTATGEREV
jgi:hypothetical protein